jgi:hypothetical protein
MSSRRNRIIYASQSVIVDGDFLYRVQTLGSTTTFTSADVFQLGELDIIDVVDDVPAVAITLDTNDWGSIDTIATLAGVSKSGFTASAANGNSNMTVVSGTTEIAYYHGVALSNFGASNWFDLWAPVQTEASLGTAANNVDQSLYLPKCYVNNIAFSYSAGANATENYGAETDTKYWFLNGGRFISQEEWDCSGGESSVTLGLIPTASGVAQLSDSSYGFLYSTDTGQRAICHIKASDSSKNYYAIDTAAATATKARFTPATNVITLPTGATVTSGDVIKVRYAANAYAQAGVGTSTRKKSGYFTALVDGDTGDPEDVGALRQGQVEIYLVDPDVSTPGSAYEISLRLTSCTITANLTREALNELGHLKPYDRPLTFPTEITTAVEATAGDLETFARFAGKEAVYDNATLVDLTISHLMTKDNLVLVVMLYQQTDEEAGGATGSSRKVLSAEMVGTEYFVRGTRSSYAAINTASPEREYPLKTIIVPGLKITDEGFNNAVGQNATQSFSFRSVNKMFVLKGYVDIADVLCTPGIQVNT